MIILFCWLENLNVALILVTIAIINLLATDSFVAVNGAELPLDSRLVNSKIQYDSKTPPASEFLQKSSNKVTTTVTGSGGSNFCAAPCACLGDYIECKKQGLRQVPVLPDWVQSLDLTGNKLNDNVENTIGNLQLLSSLNLKKNHLTRFPVFRGLVSLEKLNLAHNRIQAISVAALRSLPELKELELIKNRIKTIDTDSFPSPNQLSILNLNGNQIEYVSVGSFDNLNNLVELYLSHNNLNELPHDIFKSLSVLKKLDLSFNHLNISWGIFKGLDQLRVLKIRANGIEYLPDGVFQALKSIAVIELDSNRITNLSRNGFFTLNTLTTLSLANNTLKHLETDTWEFVQQLVALDLSQNQLSEVSRNDFKCLTKLKKLHLQFNSIKYFDDGSLACLANLEYLDLSGNQLSTTIEGTPGPFVSLKKLETLELRDNDIKSINKKAFLGLENVEYLNLNGNNITTIQVNAFEPLKHLDRIVLNSTHFLCDCNLQWLYSWFSLHIAKHRDDDETQWLVCDYPPEVRGQSLLSLNEKEDFLCNESPKPKLINELKNQLAIKGTNVTLECTAISSVAEPMTFQWRRDNVDIKPNETETVHQDLNNNTMMSSRLHLYNVNREHNGKYQCVVTNSFGSAYSQRFKITVASYPGFRRKPTNVTLSAGSTARLDCSAYGEPMPQIAWQKDGGNEFPAARERRMNVMTTDDAFFIINAKPSDMGVYTCTAENPAGTIKANATLTVHETPGFLKPTEVREEILVGKSFVLDCFIRGSPRPNLNWYKDDQRLKATDRLYFAAENQLMIVTDSAYTDAGVYKCEIKNELGSAYRYMTVKVSKTISKAIVNGDEMTGIIIITILCCTIVTSFICGVIIYQTKKGNECNNNSYLGNATSRSMNLQSRFLFHQQQQQHANQTDDGDISAGNLYSTANGNLPSSHDNADCTSNKDSGTGDSTKRSRSVDDINVNDTYSNCSNNPTADSIELATYSANTSGGEQQQQMVPLVKSSRNHNHSPDKLPPLPPPSSNSHQRQSSSSSSPTILSINNNNSNSNNTLANNSSPTSLHSSNSSKSNKNRNNYLSNCNGPSYTITEQKLPLIQNHDDNENNSNKTSCSNHSSRNNYNSHDTNGIPPVSLTNHSSTSSFVANGNSLSI